MKWMGIALVGAVMLCMGMGCQSKVYEENQKLWQQNRELQAKVNELEGAKSSTDPAQIAAMQAEIAKRDAEIADLNASLKQGDKGAPATPGLAGIDAKYDARAGTVTVTVPGNVLFDSGKADLKTSSQSTLNKIAAAIKQSYPGKRIYVDGHTDSDPVTRSKEKWDDNLDLSAARAMSVERYLIARGIPASRVVARAYGANNPKATKEASRRVEIVVVTR